MATTIPNIVNSLTGSTLDIQKLATDLVAAVRAPQQAALDAKLTKEQAIVSSVGKIVSAASSLKTGLASWGDPRSLAYTPSGDNNATFTFHPSSPARPVDFTFKINQVATMNSVSMAGITNTALRSATGSLVFASADGATIQSLSLRDAQGNPVYNTVEDLQAAISGLTGFKASVVNGSDLSTSDDQTTKYLTISHGLGAQNVFSVKNVVAAGATPWQSSTAASVSGMTDSFLSSAQGKLNIYASPRSQGDVPRLSVDLTAVDGAGNRLYRTLADVQAAVKKGGYTATISNDGGVDTLNVSSASAADQLIMAFDPYLTATPGFTAGDVAGDSVTMAGIKDTDFPPSSGKLSVYGYDAGGNKTVLANFDFSSGGYPTLDSLRDAILAKGFDAEIQNGSGTPPSRFLTITKPKLMMPGITDDALSQATGNLTLSSGGTDYSIPLSTTSPDPTDNTKTIEVPLYTTVEALQTAIKARGFDATLITSSTDPTIKYLSVAKGSSDVSATSTLSSWQTVMPYASATIGAEVVSVSSLDANTWQPITGPKTKVMTPVADSFFKTAHGVLKIDSDPPTDTPLFSIDLNATDTNGHKLYNSLSDVQSAINQVAGLSATISIKNNLKQLSISSGYGLSPIQVSLGNPPSTVADGLNFSASATSRGVDASVTVGSDTVTSHTNAFSNLVSDLIININPTASTNPPPTVHLTTTSNTDQCKQILADVVTAYNNLMVTINNEIKYDADIKKRGGLNNNSVARSFLWQMRDLTTTYIPTGPKTSVTLADVGVATNQDGTLSLDQTKLASVVANSPGLLESVLSSSIATADYPSFKDAKGVSIKKGASIAGALERMTKMASVIVDPTSAFNGLANTAQKTDIPKIQADVTKLNDEMTALQAKYLQQFSAMQTAVQLSKNTQDSLTQSMASWSAGLKG